MIGGQGSWQKSLTGLVQKDRGMAVLKQRPHGKGPVPSLILQGLDGADGWPQQAVATDGHP